ncbi:MAG: FecR family protein, partial [Anaerolineales bacterium]|nr:FecR family protein [Anaerolineales bacterium]
MTKLNRKFSSTRNQLVRLLFTLYVVLSILVTACGGGAPVPSEETIESVTEPTEVSVEVEPTEVVAPVAEPTSIVPSTDKEEKEKEEEIVEEAAPVVETVAEVLLTVLTGRVDYMLPGTEEWQQALGEEIPLDIGTQLRAYQLSSARLDLLDGSKVLMKPVSQLGMTTYVHEPETPVTQAYVDIPEGEAAFDVNGPLAGADSSFLVKMPTGVFSVNPEAEEIEESVPETPEEQPEPEAAEAATENPVTAATEEELNLADVTLNVLSGRVDFLLPGSDDWQLADGEAFSVDLGTEVRTYQLSMARLDLADGSKIMMKPTSKVSVTSYLHEPATPVTQAYVSVPEGEAAFDVNGPLAGPDSSFMVEMPTGVFSVTGTSFVVNAGNTDQPAQINLLEGTVVAGATTQNAETGELEAMFFEMEAGEDGAAMNFMSSEQAAEIVVESGQETDVQQQVAAMSVVTAQGSDGIEVAAESGLAAAVEQGLESGTAGVLSEEQIEFVETAAEEGALSEVAPVVIAAEELAEALAAEPGEDSVLAGTGVEIKTAVEALTGDGTAAREGAIDGALQSFEDAFEGPQSTVVT